MLSIHEINLLEAQNKALKKQNSSLQKELRRKDEQLNAVSNELDEYVQKLSKPEFESLINPTDKEIYESLLHKFGDNNQIIVAIEELSELVKELCKYLRNARNEKNLTEEMADVEIMLEQLKLILDNESDVAKVKDEKILRTKERYLKEDTIC